MSKQPHIEPPDTEPLSCVISRWLSTIFDDTPAMLVPREDLTKWIRIASSWEKLAATFEAARREDQAENKRLREALKGIKQTWREYDGTQKFDYLKPCKRCSHTNCTAIRAAIEYANET